ncbi:unnamed protein product [Rotaria sordida]|uniref:F-box domain-containing protein n=1 Tax=Rotaria sordida TaxID=392033 RepID=A0A815KGL5_9BILA|nr:unnamed protein product [Rotaria sordida]
MSQSNLHLLDLPNELLFIILNKFGNVNALYSLLGRINERFDSLLQDNAFTKTLHLIKISSTYDDISSFDDSILNRFCSGILPKIHHNVKHLTLESKSMKRILLCGNYSNLVSLKLFHFTQDIAFFYFTDQSIFRHIFKDQIIELTLLVDDDLYRGRSLKDYTDDNLPHLKCFSLICYEKTNAYDNRVLPLLRRMTYLEKLTLYLRLHDRNIFVNGTHLHREILMHMSQPHTFIFYISTEIEINDSIDRLSDNDIQQTFTNIGYHRVACAMMWTDDEDSDEDQQQNTYRNNDQITQRYSNKGKKDKCNCRRGCSKRSCCCFKFGSGCNTSCGCGTSCQNMFNYLNYFFGEDGAYNGNSCFTKWLIKHAKNADELKMIDRKKLHQSIMQSPSYRKVRKDEEFADWMKQWCKISEYEEIEHIQKFFRILLSDDTSNYYYYSFCYNDRMIFDINVCSNDRYLDITIL